MIRQFRRFATLEVSQNGPFEWVGRRTEFRDVNTLLRRVLGLCAVALSPTTTRPTLALWHVS